MKNLLTLFAVTFHLGRTRSRKRRRRRIEAEEKGEQEKWVHKEKTREEEAIKAHSNLSQHINTTLYTLSKCFNSLGTPFMLFSISVDEENDVNVILLILIRYCVFLGRR